MREREPEKNRRHVKRVYSWKQDIYI